MSDWQIIRSDRNEVLFIDVCGYEEFREASRPYGSIGLRNNPTNRAPRKMAGAKGVEGSTQQASEEVGMRS